MQIICGAAQKCGFRVDADYYVRKRRYQPGLCARCNGPIRIVEDYTETVVVGASMEINPTSPNVGRVVKGGV